MPERMERFTENNPRGDYAFAEKIWGHLGARKDMSFYDVDAFYFDYSVLPDSAKEHKMYRDSYLLYGVTDKGEVITKWEDRWEFDKEC